MKWYKYFMTAAGVSAVVMACIVLPPYLAKKQDVRQAEQEAVNTEEEVPVFQKSQMDTISKLSLAMEADKSMSSVTVQAEKMAYSSASDQTEFKNGNTAIREEDVVNISIRELKKLEEAGIIPSLDLTESPEMTSHSLYTYTDSKTPSIYTLEWKVFLSYPGFSVNLTLEDESSTIYGFTLDMEKEHAQDLEGLPQKWAEYLGLDLAEQIEEDKGVMGTYCENGTVTWFRFRQIDQPDAISILPAVPVIAYE